MIRRRTRTTPPTPAAPTAGVRWRLVTRQDNTDHVSSIALSEVEALDYLTVDALLHTFAGWDVATNPWNRFEIVCHRNGTTRIITARPFSPMDDNG